MKESKGALVAEPMADIPPPRPASSPRCHHRRERQSGQGCPRPRHADRRYGPRCCGECHDLARGCGEEHLADARRDAEELAAAMPQPAATGTDMPKLGLMLAAAERVAGGGSEGVVVVDIDPRGLARARLQDWRYHPRRRREEGCWPGRRAQCHQGCPNEWQARGVDAVEVGRGDEVRRHSDRSRLTGQGRSLRHCHASGWNIRRGQSHAPSPAPCELTLPGGAPPRRDALLHDVDTGMQLLADEVIE